MRPSAVQPLNFDDFLLPPHRIRSKADGFGKTLPVVPFESVIAGDIQVLVGANCKFSDPPISIDRLADFPSVNSVIARQSVEITKKLPAVREFIAIREVNGCRITGNCSLNNANLDKLPAIESLRLSRGTKIDLERLQKESLRNLTVSHWGVKTLEPLAKMTALNQLYVEMFKDSLEILSHMTELTYMRVEGEAKSWASLRECTQLKNAWLDGIAAANMKRLNTWAQLQSLRLGGRALKSLAGIEACQKLEYLCLCNTIALDPSPVCDLPALKELYIWSPGFRALNLESLTPAGSLRRLEIAESVDSKRDLIHISSLNPLSEIPLLEELVLKGCTITDGDLSPLAGLEHLRRVKLDGYIGCDVDKLQKARPDIIIEHDAESILKDGDEMVGQVGIWRPREGLEEWFILISLADELGVATNYQAEQVIKRNLKAENPELLKRLHWDTEAGNVSISAKEEKDIRAVAEVINSLSRDAGNQKS